MSRVYAQRAEQAFRINVLGILCESTAGDQFAVGKVAFSPGADWPVARVETPFGYIAIALSWDHFDNLAIAASNKERGLVKF